MISDGRRRALLVALAALPTGCTTGKFVAAPAAPPGPPRVAVGDRWRYVEINRYNGRAQAELEYTVRAVTPAVVVAIVDSRGIERADEIHDTPWRVRQETAYDMPLRFETAVPVIPSVLQPGARDRIDTVYRVPGADDRYDWKMWLDALGWQRIEVPAGGFDCLVIRRRIWFRHRDLFRVNSARTETLWYAPAANRWVQREWTGEYRSPSLFRTVGREDSVAWRLTDYVPAPGRSV